MASMHESKDHLAAAGEEAARRAEASVEAASGEIRRLKAKLRANGEELQDSLREAGDRFAEGAATFGSSAREQIREHPLAAAGIAFAAGVVLARLLRSR